MNFSFEGKKIIAESYKGGLGISLSKFIRSALPQHVITIYEAFQLMEISNRFWHGDKFWSTPRNVVDSMNLALVAKLFRENAMYEQFYEDSIERLAVWHKVAKKSNGGKTPKGGHYILDDLEGFLSCDLEHMEKLSYIRKHSRRNNPGMHDYHFESFPYDYLKYEDELLKILKGETDHYEVDKTISPEICDMMVAIELRADELS